MLIRNVISFLKINAQIESSKSKLTNFRWHLLSEIASLKDLLSNVLRELQYKSIGNFEVGFQKILNQELHFASPHIQQTLKAIFLDLKERSQVDQEA